MLAGVGGIDAALLVIAADEGVMPQTREHLAILDLLEVKAGLVALTKIDLVDDPEWLEMVEEEVKEHLKGTVLEDAPIVRVSARTGEGLDELLARLQEVLSHTPQREDKGRPRLPIDRVFTIAGFGTVVTGTLIDGRLYVGQEVEILPQKLRARIRGLQSHKQKIQEASPGSRVAVNLSGVNKEQLARGNVLTTPEWLVPTTLVDVHLRYLADAPYPLPHNAQVKFFSGSAEVMARVRVLDRDYVKPGEEAFVQLRLEEPVPLVKGDGFIIRWPSPAVTVGGGKVVEPHPARKHRRFRPEVIEHLRIMAWGSPEEIVLHTLQLREPARFSEVVARSGFSKDETARILSTLAERGELFPLSPAQKGMESAIRQDAYLVSAQGWKSILERITSLLADYHKRHPLRKGMPREEAKSRLRMPGGMFNEAIARAVTEGKVIEEEALLRLPEHKIAFTPRQQRLVDELLAEFRKSPYATPSVARCEEKVGPEVFNALLETGRLVRVSPDVVFLTETYREMVRRVVERLKREGRITVAQVRDMFGTSRKYALALMEHLDERKITKRVGDERVLLREPE